MSRALDISAKITHTTDVKADPLNKNGKDENKVSHHILRVGYHFRAEVVEDACVDLDYVNVRGKFVKQTEANMQSILARTMMNHGLRPVPGAGLAPERETNDQIRAAVKELFPRIPDDDLEAIIRHAWEEGSKRVGNNAFLTLPRRVQLATIARIRHQYTDYDRLLRAFEWKQARLEVEPMCVAKLLEWRGENESDDQVEEIVREVIVIDDDDDDDDDNDNHSASLAQPYNDGLQTTYQQVAYEDHTAERVNEPGSQLLDEYQRPLMDWAQRDMDIRRRVDEIRQKMRDQAAAVGQSIVRVNVPVDQVGNETVVMDGVTYHKAPASMDTPMQPIRTPLAPLPATDAFQGLPSHDRPIASIESDDGILSNGHPHGPRTHGSRPGHFGNPDLEPGNRVILCRDMDGNVEFIDLTLGSPPPPRRPQDGHPTNDHHLRSAPQYSHDRIVDLTRNTSSGSNSPQTHYPADRAHPHVLVPGQNHPTRTGFSQHHSASGPVPQYILPQANGVVDARPEYQRHGLVNAQIAPIQYAEMKPRHLRTISHPHTQYAPPGPRVVYVQTAPAHQVPQPVHGALAPVQMMQRDASRATRRFHRPR
jgi:hypothetical protein